MTDDIDHAIDRIRSALEQSHDIGWLDASNAAARYLRRASADMSHEVRIAVLRLAGDIADGMHKRGSGYCPRC